MQRPEETILQSPPKQYCHFSAQIYILYIPTHFPLLPNLSNERCNFIYVTFHAKTYTNGFVFNGLSHWVAIGNLLKAFTKLMEVLEKAAGSV